MSFSIEILAKNHQRPVVMDRLSFHSAVVLLGKLQKTKCDLSLTLFSDSRYIDSEFFSSHYRGSNEEKASWLRLYLRLVATENAQRN